LAVRIAMRYLRTRPAIASSLAGLALLLALSGGICAATLQPTVIAVCSKSTSLIRTQIRANGHEATVRATCNPNGRGEAVESESRAQLSFSLTDAAPRSISSAELSKSLEVRRELHARRQVTRINFADKRPCVSVTASADRVPAALSRFVGSNGDWGSSVDYMIDPDCTVLVVALGNKLALVPTGARFSFELYGVNFVTEH